MRKTIVLLACFLMAMLVLPGSASASWYLHRPPSSPPASPPVSEPPATQPPATQPPSTQPPATQPPSTQPPDAVPLTAQESVALSLVNQARVQAGLAPLIVDPVLTDLARKKAQDMVVNNYFSHISPTYGSPYQMEVAAGIRARVMGGENIAKARNAQYAHAMFMGSAGHRANILNPNYTHIGIGIVANGPYGISECQLFLGR